MQAQETNKNDERVDLYDLTFDQLETFLTETIGEPKFRTKQVFRWLYEHEVRDFSSMTNLSKAVARVARFVIREYDSKIRKIIVE